MMSSLSRRERRLIMGAVAVAVLVGGWLLLVEPAMERNRIAQEVIPARQELLARRLELVSRKDAIAGDLEAVNGKINTLGGRFLTAATPGVAASELQKIVKDTAGQVNTEVRSERILPTVDRGEILEVPIEITVSGEIRQLVDLLARLETAPKLLTIQDLKLRVVNVSQPKEILGHGHPVGLPLDGPGLTDAEESSDRQRGSPGRRGALCRLDGPHGANTVARAESRSPTPGAGPECAAWGGRRQIPAHAPDLCDHRNP